MEGLTVLCPTEVDTQALSKTAVACHTCLGMTVGKNQPVHMLSTQRLACACPKK